ncbi:MAG: response regulator [Chloroflexi bacterium]|nr:response regulator [Chloroflexota bacterium]
MQTNGQKPVILIVDDEEGVRTLLRGALEEAGYSCKMARSGQHALELVAKETVDLALVDVLMPGMPGSDLVQYIQASHPDIAVVLVTAMRELEFAVDCVKAGAYDFITKPIQLDRLVQRVTQALERRQRRLEEQQQQLQAKEQVVLMGKELEHRIRELEALNQAFQRYLGRELNLRDMVERLLQTAERASEQSTEVEQQAKRIIEEIDTRAS